MAQSDPERQEPERTRLDHARDEIVFGLTNTPPEFVGHATTPSEHIEGVSFEAKKYIVDATIKHLRERGFIDPSAFRERTPEEAPRVLGVHESTIERWQRMGLLNVAILPLESPSFLGREAEDSGEEDQKDEPGDGEGGIGVREPRRPYPSGGEGSISLSESGIESAT